MRRVASIVLLIGFLGLGTGALEYLHHLQHAHAAARAMEIIRRSGTPIRHPQQDDSNCFVCVQLHLPTIAVAWVPLLILLGIFLAFVTEIAHPLISQRARLLIACRGPPIF